MKETFHLNFSSHQRLKKKNQSVKTCLHVNVSSVGVACFSFPAKTHLQANLPLKERSSSFSSFFIFIMASESHSYEGILRRVLVSLVSHEDSLFMHTVFKHCQQDLNSGRTTSVA